MQMINAGGGLAGLTPGMGMGGMNNNFFLFTGNSLSLQARLDSLTSQDIEKIVDAHITVTGT